MTSRPVDPRKAAAARFDLVASTTSSAATSSAGTEAGTPGRRKSCRSRSPREQRGVDEHGAGRILDSLERAVSFLAGVGVRGQESSEGAQRCRYPFECGVVPGGRVQLSGVGLGFGCDLLEALGEDGE